MLEKQLLPKTQILTVEPVVDSIHFKHRYCPFPVNFFPGWLAILTEVDVIQIGAIEPNTLEALLTYQEHWLFAIVLTPHDIGVGYSRTISRWGLVSSVPYIEGWQIPGPMCWFVLDFPVCWCIHVNACVLTCACM